MFGISTVWPSKETDAMVLLKRLEHFNLDGIELEYRISSQMYGKLCPLAKSMGTSVLSLHNTCPAPEGISGQTPSLSSCDAEERRLAVELACKTIRNAHDLEAQTVVIHLGAVEVEKPKKFIKECKRGEIPLKEAIEHAQAQQDEREEKKDIFFDNALFSLESILKEADKRSVNIGLENRYYVYEIPSFDEVGSLLEEFSGSKLGYWHDTGHAHVMDVLNIKPHEAWLKAYRPIGMHLHDAVNLDDHQAPGRGDIDWNKYASMFPKDIIKILEIRPGESQENIEQGILLLKELGIFV